MQIAAMYYKDRAKVNFLTNTDLIDEKKSNGENYIPQLVQTYRKHMGHVDKVDSFLSNYKFSNRNRKWTDAHFKTCLKMCVDNCWIIYKEIGNEKVSLEKFIVELAKEMVNEYSEESTNDVEDTHQTKPSSENGIPQKVDKKGRCKICWKNGIDSSTVFICTKCFDYVHPQCFESHHHLVK